MALCGEIGMEWHCIVSSKPMQTGNVESFNSRMHDKVLNETLFMSMAQAQT